MMKSFTNLVVVTLIVGLSYSVEYASSIQCYDCGFRNGKACGNLLDSNITSSCSASVCSIYKVEPYGIALISRQCGIDIGKRDPGVTHGEKDLRGVKFTWRTCETDLCNWGDV